MQFDQLRRREFITLLGGGAAAARPLAARAQQQVPVIGYLGGASPEAFASRLQAFRQPETGYREGRDVMVEYRWAESQVDRRVRLRGCRVQTRRAVLCLRMPMWWELSTQPTRSTRPLDC